MFRWMVNISFKILVQELKIIFKFIILSIIIVSVGFVSGIFYQYLFFGYYSICGEKGFFRVDFSIYFNYILLVVLICVNFSVKFKFIQRKLFFSLLGGFGFFFLIIIILSFFLVGFVGVVILISVLEGGIIIVFILESFKFFGIGDIEFFLIFWEFYVIVFFKICGILWVRLRERIFVLKIELIKIIVRFVLSYFVWYRWVGGERVFFGYFCILCIQFLEFVFYCLFESLKFWFVNGILGFLQFRRFLGEFSFMFGIFLMQCSFEVFYIGVSVFKLKDLNQV